MDRTAQAIACYKDGFHCSQAVLSAFADVVGLDDKTALKLSAGFAGGCGRAEMCGAVAAALIVISLKYGKDTPKDRLADRRTFERVRAFSEKFEAKNGTLKCKNLLGFDISTREGRKEAAKGKVFSTRCPGFVADAVEILQEIL
ncbi:C-GCAxxG-C-C family protein [Desulfovibrio inopinatus]|uniref:C-GCAxxG-C-C family protein n=1 Tax=Desulfovibrio inopinatus TaxID=102109 RepID=UPI000420D092|nr:C-GCAxxG-C-C family protein [Desulfovibrio inopinatus]